MILLDIFVGGKPRGQGSMRAIPRKGGGAPIVLHNSDTMLSWRTSISEIARAEWGRRPAIDGPCALRVAFIYMAPKSQLVAGDEYVPGTRRRVKVLRDGAAPITRSTSDLDKSVRLVSDALEQGGVMVDDAQITEVTARKLYTIEASEQGARIQVRSL